MYTFQDFQKEKDVITGVTNAISRHLKSDDYLTAVSADNYDKQRNETINNYVKTIFTLTGQPIADFTASNNKLCSNFFHRLNTQRNTYLLGNGVSFEDNIEEQEDEDGNVISVDTTKEALGKNFDAQLKDAGYKALIHGISFGFWNLDHLHVFPLTEFVPLWDEEDGSLKAGVRFWRIDENKPMYAVLYEIDGYTKFKSKANSGMDFEEIQSKKGYKITYNMTEAAGEEVIGESNYSNLPIVPFWGSKLKQSTLIGLREKIDSYDLIRSGFANDLTDCAQVYWIIENCGGMTDEQLARFRDRLKITHIATADTENSKVSPYTQEIPYNARKEYLNEIRSGIYEDFGGLDVHAVSANSTNDHLEAAYQPLDEEADDYEFQVIEFIHGLLDLIDIEDTPIFKRNRISNQPETTQMILSAAEYLDEETVLKKLPFITVDEVMEILNRKNEESTDRFETEDEFEDEELTLDDIDDEDMDYDDSEFESQIDDLEKLLEE